MEILNFSNPDYLPWLIPVGPLLAFFIITLATNRAKLVPATSHEYGGHHPDYDGMLVPVVTQSSRVLSVVVGMVGILLALLISFAVVGYGLNPPHAIHHFGEEIFASNMIWMDTGDTFFSMGVMVDPLTVVTLFMVAIACTCIFIYSIGYMAHDPRQSRFFSFIALFAGAMLTLVVADNLLLLFVGWEIMGLCSYLLIGFWFEKKSAYEAAIKAFVTTRVADVFMLLGVAYLYAETGTLSFREILYANNGALLEHLVSTPAIIFGGSAASVIGILLIIGAVGKSAQFPLHVWLPDAMEGPTPVSAMIHAAAMVSAGIYMIIRMYPLLQAGSDLHHGELSSPMMMMAIIGGFTALFAATIAVAQNDVKRVLAYSTISQLGFMMAALGIGAYIAAAFHLIMHAFFKALLFMASGAVIHGMEHGEHHAHEHGHHAEEGFDPQDMMFMGGLRHKIPVTWWTFLAGGMSLSGLPLITAGFWSKDEILADAFYGINEHGLATAYGYVFVMLVLAAFLTAFYTTRQLGLTFWGEPRSEAAKHAGLGGPRNIVSITMQLPLIILAVLAVIGGYVGVPSDFPLFGSIFSPEHNWFHHFVGATLIEELEPHTLIFNIIPVLFSFAVALGGIYAGWWMYWRKPLQAGEPDPLVAILGPIHEVLKNKWYVDELYGVLFVRPSQWFARVVVSEVIDNGIIDGILHLIARVGIWIGDLFKVLNTWLIDGVGDGIPMAIGQFGSRFRHFQTGRVQQYLLYTMVVVIIIGIIFALSSGILQAGG